MDLVLALVGAAANIIMAGAAIWGVRAWRKQSEWNRQRDMNHGTALLVLRAAHRARAYVVMACHLGPVLRPIIASKDHLKLKALENEMNRLNPGLEAAHAAVIEASFEARVVWGDQEKPLLEDLRRLNQLVEGTRNALAVLVFDLAGVPRQDDHAPFPMPWDWQRMIDGDDGEWQKMRAALTGNIERIDTSLARYVATRSTTSSTARAPERPVETQQAPPQLEVQSPTGDSGDASDK